MRDQILSILSDVKPTVDFASANRLLASGALDSFDVLVLVNELSAAFGVRFSPRDLTRENFDSADSIAALIADKLQKKA